MVLLWVSLDGFVIGVVAKLLTPGRDSGALLVTSALGIGGAVWPTSSATPWASTRRPNAPGCRRGDRQRVDPRRLSRASPLAIAAA